MLSTTSPPRSAGNPSSNTGRASMGRVSDAVNPFAKRHSLEDINDSSSITTRSSSTGSRSKSRPCHVCKEWSSKSKPLIQCSRCNGKWHPCCHKPEILDTKAADFMCQRCQEKELNHQSTSEAASFAPPEPRRCEMPKCKNHPLTESVGGKVLCKYHEMEQKHHKQKQVPAATVAAPTKKPFHKDKLYNIKPEDRHLLKRKRTSSITRRESGVPMAARKEGTGNRRLAKRTATLSDDDEMPDLGTLEDDAERANPEPSTLNDKPPAEGPPTMPTLPPSPPPPTAIPASNGKGKEPETNTSTNSLFEVSLPTPHPKSIAARKQAADFDTSDLDFWMAKQSEPKPSEEPTEKQLLESQLWGHVDPRIVWPKEYSEEWYTAKRAEIDARPSRKQRVGKVRPQVEERQFSEHQLKELERFADEFGGIKFSGDFEPEVVEGCLVMVERNDTVDRMTGEVRRKKKRDLKMYRVGN